MHYFFGSWCFTNYLFAYYSHDLRQGLVTAYIQYDVKHLMLDDVENN